MAKAVKKLLPVTEPPYEVQLTLTQEEAEFLRAAVGDARAYGPSYAIYLALHGQGVKRTEAGTETFREVFRHFTFATED
jgi:hypothetical protein